MLNKDREGLSPEKLRETLLTDILPRLCRTVGHRYFSVVDKCLGYNLIAGDSGYLPQESKEDKLSRQIWFDEVVVGQLAKCSA